MWKRIKSTKCSQNNGDRERMTERRRGREGEGECTHTVVCTYSLTFFLTHSLTRSLTHVHSHPLSAPNRRVGYRQKKYLESWIWNGARMHTEMILNTSFIFMMTHIKWSTYAHKKQTPVMVWIVPAHKGTKNQKQSYCFLVSLMLLCTSLPHNRMFWTPSPSLLHSCAELLSVLTLLIRQSTIVVLALVGLCRNCRETTTTSSSSKC